MEFICSICLDLDDAGNRYLVLTDEFGIEMRDPLNMDWEFVNMIRIWYALSHDCVI